MLAFQRFIGARRGQREQQCDEGDTEQTGEDEMLVQFHAWEVFEYRMSKVSLSRWLPGRLLWVTEPINRLLSFDRSRHDG